MRYQVTVAHQVSEALARCGRLDMLTEAAPHISKLPVPMLERCSIRPVELEMMRHRTRERVERPGELDERTVAVSERVEELLPHEVFPRVLSLGGLELILVPVRDSELER